MNIITNNQEREFIDWTDLSKKEQEEFDWMKNPEEHNFFRYRDWIYSLDDFMVIDKQAPKEFQNWDGYSSDSFFSGILIKYCDDGEFYKVATYIS